jgi:hypothetical protein
MEAKGRSAVIADASESCARSHSTISFARQGRAPSSSPKYVRVQGTLLTRPMAVVLMAHADGPRQIRNSDKERHTIKALKARRLIYFNRLNRPTHTHATSRGREFIAGLLAAQADALAAMPRQ